MKRLTEKSSKEELDTAWGLVNDYGEAASKAHEVQRAFKKGAKVVYRRVNTPEKLQALYIIIQNKRQVMYMPILIVEGSEGRSFVARESTGQKEEFLTILHSHAVNRYIERHGWDGDIIDAENHILDNMWVSARNVDKYTKELTVYFDDGMFLGAEKDGICHLNTYIANKQMYSNQRLLSRRLQDNIEELFKKL